MGEGEGGGGGGGDGGGADTIPFTGPPGTRCRLAPRPLPLSSSRLKPVKKGAQRASGSSLEAVRSARCAAPLTGAIGAGGSPVRMSPASESMPIARIVHPPRFYDVTLSHGGE